MPRSLRFRVVPLFGILTVASGACGPGIAPSERAASAEHGPPASPAADEAWARGEVRLVAGDVVRVAPRSALGAVQGDASGAPGRGFDPVRARAYVASLVAEVDREAVPGAIDIDARTVTPHVTGQRLAVDASVEVVARDLISGAETIALVVETIEPAGGVVPEGLELGVVLGEYSTRFDVHGRYRPRAHNVRLASSSLHGAVIPASGTLSFNEVVGPREYRTGYKMAPVIMQGELVPGIGGGVCQAASTFHAAAFFAGLEVPVYTPHSRPSHYVPAGLDATVAYPDVDLVVRNPFDFPVLVAVSSEEETVTVRILGRARPRRVELARQIHRGAPFESRDVEDPELPLGARELTQEGSPGSIVFRTRHLAEGERAWVEQQRLEYPAVDEIFHVGTGPAPVQAGAPLAAR